MRGAQTKMDGFRPYAEKFSEVLASLAQKAEDNTNPLLVPREAVKTILVVLCTSDRGLCGGFNLNLIEAAAELIDEKKSAGAEVSVEAFGKKGRDWCRKHKLPMAEQHIGVVGGSFGFNIAVTTGRRLVESYLNGTYDEVFVVYPDFVSMGRANSAGQTDPSDSAAGNSREDRIGRGKAFYWPEHICEPSPEELLG